MPQTPEGASSKAYPIIFSGPMIRAILDGRKTQSRRLITSQWSNVKMHHEMDERCLLWVRETWADVNTENGPALAYRAGGLHFCVDDAYPVEYERYPKMQFTMWCGDLERGEPGHSWRSPLHMPRWASRLTLEVTDVRVQRLRDIAEDDAIAEGATSRPHCHGYGNRDDGWSMDWSVVGTPSKFAPNGVLTENCVALGSARSAFGSFINELHGGKNWNCKPEPSMWDTNPEVIALTFEVHHQNVDELFSARIAA